MSAAADTSQKALPIKRQRFARHYARHGNGARAAREAGYSEKTAKEIGSELLTFPNVQEAVERERKQLLLEEGVTPNGVLQMIARIAMFDIGEVFDENGRIREISEMSDVARRVVAGIDTFTVTAKDGESFSTTAKIKLPDRLRALELLARHFGSLSDNVNVSGAVAVNPFIAIIERAQGNALMPIAQRDDDDANDDERIIEGQVVEREDAPAQPMASGSTLTDFSQLDDGEDEDVEDTQGAVDMTPVAIAPKPDENISRPSDRDFAPLWRRRRRNV